MIIDVEDACFSLLHGKPFHRFDFSVSDQPANAITSRMSDEIFIDGFGSRRALLTSLRELSNESISNMRANVDAVHRTAGPRKGPDR